MTATGGFKDAPPDRAWLRGFAVNSAQAFANLLRPARVGARPSWRSPARIAVATIISVIVLAATMLWIDVPAILAAKDLPRWVIDVFEEITDFGRSGWFLGPLGVLLVGIALWASPALPRFTQQVLGVIVVRLGFLFCAIAIPGLFVTIVKRLIGRARPFVGGEADPFAYMPFAWRPEYASLPSGHSENVFAVLVAFGVLWPRWRPLLWCYALVIAASRVIVTAHHPSDVIAGALVGVVGALLVRDWFAARRLGFVIDPDGLVRTLPGPSWQRVKKVARQLFAS